MAGLTLERDGDVALVVLDNPAESVNTLSRALMDDFAATMRDLRSDAAVRALVFISAKKDNFVAGADINAFVAAKTEDEFRRMSREGQQMLDAVAAFDKPVIAAINGSCLGGGLELALACHYRIATNNPRTVLALPEVQLGIIPGAGGCNRLPRLIGLRNALDMILTAKNIRADKALKMGLVDEVVHPAILRGIAVTRAREMSGRGVPLRKERGGWLIDRSAPGQAFVLSQARKAVLKKTGGHYPAPLAAIEVVKFSLAEGMPKGLVFEADQFAKMAMTEVSRRLVEIFFATTALKKDAGVAPPAPSPRPVGRLAIIGSGFMGAGIAVVAADQAGIPVHMKDSALDRVGKGLKSVADVIRENVKRRRYHRREGERKLALVSGGVDDSGIRTADLVIEAVFEDLEVKRGVLAAVEAAARAQCIFASNTSTIPIARIAEGCRRPENVVGMHFFSPVHRMPLLEVIAAPETSKETIVTAVAFGRRIGKTVIVVQDRPGFFINRILAPYMNETGHLVAEGTPVDAIDSAMTRWGFPVGPVTLMDEVGLDVAVKAGQVMREALGDRLEPALRIDALVKAGRLGRKSGKGFFDYDDGKRSGVGGDVPGLLGVTPGTGPGAEQITRRLSMALMNEAARALEEGVIQKARDGDIGAIFGFGYPPFRGGPFRTLDAMGAAAAVATLEDLASRHGSRFAPAQVLRDQAKSGGRFYPPS